MISQFISSGSEALGLLWILYPHPLCPSPTLACSSSLLSLKNKLNMKERERKKEREGGEEGKEEKKERKEKENDFGLLLVT